ncbi:MAG: hypothetical protein H0W84_10985 [Bacteroidetes bacterium]|nr:hypothetical protein [Bacteroidota bacterium]
MEDIEIINLWKDYDKKLNKNILLNRKNAEEITKIKAQTLLSSMKPLKIFTILVGIIWVGFIDVLIISLFHIASPFFLISAGMLVLLNKLAMGIYLYQIILIHQVDFNEPILVIQKKLTSLKSTTIWVARILFLQLPLWTTFYLSVSIFQGENIAYLFVNGVVTLLFTYISIWLFVNIKYENRDKRWFKLIFNGKEWYPIIKSIELYKEIEEFKQEN